MSSIDKRVVQFVIDDGDFQKGISRVSHSLDDIDRQLNEGGGVKTFLRNLADGIDAISFSPIVQGVSAVTSSFMEVLGNVVGMAANKVGDIAGDITGISKTLFNMAKTGGLRRALNLDQAKFQLQNLGIEYDKLAGDIKRGVGGTPFSNDAAAKAAAQLAAAGVDYGTIYDGDRLVGEASLMGDALLSISAIAIQTNSSFEDITHTLAGMAAMGRVGGDDLFSLANRGLAAAQILADYLNKTHAGFNLTQQDIKDMVSKGEISFETFVDAIIDKFAKGVTEANSTYDGAVSNMKAAINRIGADFATPYVDVLKVLAEKAKKFFSTVQKGLNATVPESEEFISLWGYTSKDAAWGGWSAVRAWEQNLQHVGETAAYWIDHFTETNLAGKIAQQILPLEDAILHSTASVLMRLMDTLGQGIDQVVDSGLLGEMLEPLAVFFWDFDDILFDAIPKIGEILGNMFGIGMKVLEFFTTFTEFVGITGSNFQEFAENFHPIQDVLNIISDLTAKFKEFVDTLKPNEETLNIFADSVSRITSVFEKLRGSSDGIGTNLETSVFGIFGEIPDFLNGAIQFILSVATPAIEAFGQVLAWASPYIENFAKNLKTYFDETIFSLSDTGSVLTEWGASIRKGVEDIAKVATESGSFEEFKKNFASVEASLGDPGKLLGNIASFAGTAIGALSDVLTVLSTFTGPVFDKLLHLPSFVNDLMGMLGGLLGQLKLFKEVTGSISDNMEASLENTPVSEFAASAKEGIEGLLETLNNFKNTFLETIQDPIKMAEIFKNIWLSISGVVSGLAVGATIKGALGFAGLPKTLKGTAEAFTGIAETIKKLPESGIKLFGSLEKITAGFFDVLNNGLKTLQGGVKVENVRKIAESLLMMAAAIAILAVVVKNLEPEEMGAVLGTFLAMIGIIGIAIGAMTKIASKAMDLEKVTPDKLAAITGIVFGIAAMITAIGAAVLLMSLAMAVISLVDPARYLQSLGAILAMVLTMAAAMLLISAAVKIASGPNDVQFAAELAVMCLAMLSIATSVLMLVPALLIFGLLPEPILTKGLVSIMLIIVTLGLVMAAIAAASSGRNVVGIVGFSTALLALVPVLITMAVIVDYFSNPEMDPANLVKGMSIVGGFLVLVSLMASAAAKANPGSFIGLAGVIKALTGSLLALSVLMLIFANPELDPKNIARAALTLLAMMGMMALFMGIIIYLQGLDKGDYKVTETIAMLLAMTLSIVSIGAVLVVFTLLGPAILAGTLMLAAALIGLGFLMLIIAGLSEPLTAGSVAMFIFAASLAAFGAAIYLATNLILAAVALFAGVAPALAVMLEQSLEIVKEHAPKIQEGLGLATETSLKGVSAGISNSAPDIGQAIIDLILGLIASLKNNATAFIASGMEFIMNLGIGIMNIAGWLIQLVVVLGAKLVMGLAEGIYKNSKVIGIAVGIILESVALAILSFLNEIVGAFGPLGGLLEGAINDMTNHVDAALANANEQLSANEDELKQTVADMGSSAVEEGMADISTAPAEDTAHNLTDTLSSTLGADMSALPFNDILGSSGMSFDGFAELENVKGAGEGVASGMGEGFETEADSSFPAITENAQSALAEPSSSAIEKAKSGGINLGEMFGMGYAQGISSGAVSEAVASAIDAMVERAIAAANEKQDSQSPSRVAMGIGEYFGEGYALGIGNTVGMVGNYAETMVESAQSTLVRSMGSVWDTINAIDWDMTPTISPVVDLSNAYAASSEMGRLFGRGSVIQGNYMSGAYRESLAAGGNSYGGDVINISLQYDAGADANELVMGIARAIKLRSLTKG